MSILKMNDSEGIAEVTGKYDSGLKGNEEMVVVKNTEPSFGGITVKSNPLPVPEIRASLVDTAVKFLTIPKVISQPEGQKVSFLEKKGLTRDEINVALRQAHGINGSVQQYTPQFQIAPLSPLQPPALPPKTVWSTLRSSTNFVVFIAGITFGFHYLYKNYIGPFLTGKRPKSSEDSLLEVQHSIMVVLQQIQSTLERMDRSTFDHNKILLEMKQSEELVSGSSDLYSMQDIKTELNTIKGLLINRKTFPAPPSASPSIPLWQKRFPKPEDETPLENKNNEEETQILNGDLPERPQENKDSEASPTLGILSDENETS